MYLAQIFQVSTPAGQGDETHNACMSTPARAVSTCGAMSPAANLECPWAWPHVQEGQDAHAMRHQLLSFCGGFGVQAAIHTRHTSSTYMCNGQKTRGHWGFAGDSSTYH